MSSLTSFIHRIVSPRLTGALLALATIGTSPSIAHALGFGAEVGRVDAKAGPAGNTRGVFGRLGLIGPLHAELDLAKTEYDQRVDRRYGLGLRLDLPFFGKLVPALMAGTGLVTVDAPGWEGELAFTELGVGLAYRFNSVVHAELDFRQGDLEQLDTGDDGAVPSDVLPGEGRDEYRAVQLGLSINF
jgi:hypothetical protein